MDIQLSSATAALQPNTSGSASSGESKAAADKQPEQAVAPETKDVSAKVDGGAVVDVKV
ncbi:MAG: hypothetical protein ACFBZ9_14100 [Sphingomonadales bacterium]